MADWVGQVSAADAPPWSRRLGCMSCSAERVHADDTTVPVLDPAAARQDGAAVVLRRAMTAVRRQGGGRAVLYCYSPDRKGEHPRAHLASFPRHPAADALCRICRPV